MAFEDLVRKSGKGLDVSKELVCVVEINLGGTLGTQYFADKNVTVEGTYYDGRLMRRGSITRQIFPDVGYFEISDFKFSLANHDDEFNKPKWARWINGNTMKFRVAFHGTRDLLSSDWDTRYNGYIEDINYDYSDNTFVVTAEDRMQKILKKEIPRRVIQDGDFPGLDYHYAQIGSPIPSFYGEYSSLNVSPAYYAGVPGIVIGTYTAGTSKVMYGDHSIPWCSNTQIWDDGVQVPSGSFTNYKSGTISTFGGGTVPVFYSDVSYDVGTSVIVAIAERGTYLGEAVYRILIDHCELSDSDLGTHEFHENRMDGARLFINEHRPAKNYLDELCFQNGAILYCDSDGSIRLKQNEWFDGQYHSWSGTQDKRGTRELDEDDFLKFSCIKDASHVVNKRETLNSYFPNANLFLFYGQTNHQPSQTRLNQTRVQRIESYGRFGQPTFIDGHWDPAWLYLGRFRNPIYKAKFDCPISALPFELGDYVSVTNTRAPNEYGTQGWKEKQMEIVGLEEDYDNMMVGVEAWECYPGIPMQDLQVWFSMADGEGTVAHLEMGGKWGRRVDDYSWHELVAINATEAELWANKIGNDYVVTLDGTNQFLTNIDTGWGIGHQLDGNYPDEYSGGILTTFIKPDKLTNEMCILSANEPGGTQGWEFGVKSNGALYMKIGTGGTVYTKTSPTGQVDAGTWQAVHVGLTNPGKTRNRAFWYKNGTQIGTVSEFPVELRSPNGRDMFAVGAGMVGTHSNLGGTITGTRYYDGQIGDVAYHALGTIWPPGKMQRLFDDLKGRYGL